MNMFLQDMAFSHIPNGYSCNNPLPPVQVQDYIEWNRDTNYCHNDHVIYTDRAAKELEPSSRSKCYNFLWLVESVDVLRYYNNLPNIDNFQRIYTHDRDILDMYNNSVPVTFGGTWIPVHDRRVHRKNNLVSMIASTKRVLPGHKLRGAVVNSFKSVVDCYGRGTNDIENKITGMGSYMFHIAIENVKRDYYFSEKLIDCFLTGCVPIYWGCPSLGNFFDMRGIIAVDNIYDISKYLQLISPEMYYKMLPYIHINFHKALNHIAPERYIHDDILKNTLHNEKNKLYR